MLRKRGAWPPEELAELYIGNTWYRFAVRRDNAGIAHSGLLDLLDEFRRVIRTCRLEDLHAGRVAQSAAARGVQSERDAPR